MTETLILLRHGQSQANANGPFTGLLDAPLTDVGGEEVAHCADLLNDAELWPRFWFCFPPLRARQTVATLHVRLSRAPVRTGCDWPLAERNYGALTGRTKRDLMAEHGAENFRVWRRSVHVAPPPMPREQLRFLNHVPGALGDTESLHDAVTRVNDLWRECTEPTLRQSGAVLIVAHGNSLRALCAVLDLLDEAEVRDLNIPTEHPLV